MYFIVYYCSQKSYLFFYIYIYSDSQIYRKQILLQILLARRIQI